MAILTHHFSSGNVLKRPQNSSRRLYLVVSLQSERIWTRCGLRAMRWAPAHARAACGGEPLKLWCRRKARRTRQLLPSKAAESPVCYASSSRGRADSGSQKEEGACAFADGVEERAHLVLLISSSIFPVRIRTS